MLYKHFTKRNLIFYLCFSILLFLSGAIFYLNFSYLSRLFLHLSPDNDIAPITLLRVKILLLTLTSIGALLILLLFVPLNWIKKIDALLAPKNQTKFIFSILVLAFLFRLLWIITTPDVLVSDPGWYCNAAHLLASEGRYSDMADDDKTSAYLPIGYPFFLSLIFRLTSHSHFAGKFSHIILSLLICYLSYLISLKLANRKFANLVLILMAFFPSQIFFTRLFLSEMLFTFFFILFLYLLLFLDETKNRFILLFVAGIFLGMATLTRTLTLLFPLVVLIYFIRLKLSVTKVLGRVVLIIIGMLLLLSPWMIRNKKIMNYGVISTNGGIDLWVGNNPLANGSFNWPSVTPFDTLSDEKSADKLGFKLGIKYIKNNPFRFILLGIKKEIFLFAGDLYALYWDLIKVAGTRGLSPHIIFALISQIYYSLIFLLFLLGIFIYLFKKPALNLRWSLLCYTLVYWCGVHFIFFGEDRFHFPVIPIMVIFAVSFIQHLYKSLICRTANSESVSQNP